MEEEKLTSQILQFEICMRFRVASVFGHMIDVITLFESSLNNLKGCVRYIFAGLFCMYKREHFRNKEKCFLFHFESSSRSWDNQILTF